MCLIFRDSEVDYHLVLSLRTLNLIYLLRLLWGGEGGGGGGNIMLNILTLLCFRGRAVGNIINIIKGIVKSFTLYY